VVGDGVSGEMGNERERANGGEWGQLGFGEGTRSSGATLSAPGTSRMIDTATSAAVSVRALDSEPRRTMSG
jgi:hypothetical protein